MLKLFDYGKHWASLEIQLEEILSSISWDVFAKMMPSMICIAHDISVSSQGINSIWVCQKTKAQSKLPIHKTFKHTWNMSSELNIVTKIREESRLLYMWTEKWIIYS